MNVKKIYLTLIHILFPLMILWVLFGEYRIHELEAGFNTSMSQATYMQEKYGDAIAFIRNSTPIVYEIDGKYFLSLKEKSLREYLNYYNIPYEEIKEIPIENAFIRGR